MNLTWRSQRQIIIFSIYFLIIFIPFSLIAYFITRKVPSCFDRIQNQDEQGVDCGGNICSLRCDGNYRDIKVNFARGLKSGENRYDIFALLENFNTNVYFPNVPYALNFYGLDGILLGSASGSLEVLPQRRSAIYLPALNLAQEPKTIDLELGQYTGLNFPDQESIPQNVVVKNWQAQRGANSTLQVIGEIENSNTREVKNLSVYAMLYDDTRTVYAVSKTIVPSIAGRQKTAVAFSWGDINTPANVEFIVVYE